jgi:Xaa-Pro aminopeptidase
MNIDYATAARNMPVWTLHAPGRYAFVATDGPIILFEYRACEHLWRSRSDIEEVRTGISAFYFFGGSRIAKKARDWADQIADIFAQHATQNRRLAIDRCDPWIAQHLVTHRIELFDAQEPLEQARRLKSPEEIACLQLSMDVCDAGIERMREALQPGLTENQIWSVLHATNMAHGGDFIECKLLASGPKTFPWFHESSNRKIEAGDLVVFDTDMIGPTGYLADISRAFVCPGRSATSHQRELYALAQAQIEHNVSLLKPGVTFREFTEKAWRVPERFYPNRYMLVVHGVGLTDEYPAVLYDGDQQIDGYDGMFEENMVVSVESYLGEAGEGEGIKLEQQVLITRAGTRAFSKTPIENALEIR